LCELTVSS